MNKFLLLTAGFAMAMSVQGQSLHHAGALMSKDGVKVAATVVKGTEARPLKSANKGKLINKKVVMPAAAPARAAEGLDGGNILSESFEGWDGKTATWVPDGWTVVSNGDPTLSVGEKWSPAAANPMLPAPTDGEKFYGINYSTSNQDEWFISPAVTLEDNMFLTFDLYSGYYAWFNLDENHVDWDKYEYKGEKEVVLTVKILVREEGATEWTLVKNLVDDYMDKTLEELTIMPMTLMPYSVDLSAYAGKKVQVAFEYVGKDGDTVLLDNIKIGFASLATPVYSMPFETLYWGTDLQFQYMFACASLPAYTDLYWGVYETQENATYTWQYADPAEISNSLVSTGMDLTVSYNPSVAVTASNFMNLPAPPTVTASAPKASEASYKNPANIMQFGGKPEIDLNGTKAWVGLLPFSMLDAGYDLTVLDNPEGEQGIPVFGYSSDVDKYWTDYTFAGDNAEGDGVKLTKIFNYIMPSSSPLVVTGMHLDAKGRGIPADAEFKASIVYMDEEGVPQFDTPLASATIKGSDIIELEAGINNNLVLNFNFAEPVVIDDSQAGYIAVFEGFNNPGIEYFAPLQSVLPYDPPMYMGWLYKEITYMGETRWSATPMAYTESDYGPCINAFAINLHAYWPWLHSANETIEVGTGTTEFTIDSYYDGDNLHVVAPAWAQVTVTGGHGETLVTVTAEATDADREGQLVIEGVGVSKTFTLKQAKSSGISDIVVDGDDTVVAVFDLAGKRVDAANAAAGIYLVKYASGRVAKVAVK